MSERYPGGIISQTAPTPTGPFQNGTAPGVWTLEQQAYWQKQGLWPIAGNVDPSAFIENLFQTWLYTGNGVGQSVVNGIQLGTASTGGSAAFFPTNSYAQLSTGTSMNFGTGNWTIEFYFQGLPSNFGVLFEIFNTVGPVGQLISIQRQGTSPYAIYVEAGSIKITTDGLTPWDGQWHHHAIVRNGSTITYYIDGVSRGTFSTSLNLTGTNAVRLGNYSIDTSYGINGYLSNLRVVTGTAIYTSSFTPPTSALTAVSGTQLLCCQGSTPFVDNSANAFTITPFNGAVANVLGPFTSATPGKGGMVWIKQRNGTLSHVLTDSERGVDKAIFSNLNIAQQTGQTYITSFNSNGFSVGGLNATNQSTINFTSWTFREQPKFFDVVTYTGNGSATIRPISHNLQSVPGMMFIKRTDSAGDWYVWQRVNNNQGTNDLSRYLLLNSTSASIIATAGTNRPWGGQPTSTVFRLSPDPSNPLNINGATYVAYLFAHDAGGFGLTGNENVISCGSYTGNGGFTGPTINLGYEPQLVLIKSATTAFGWRLIDNMRGMSLTDNAILEPNNESAEYNTGSPVPISVNSTGFQITNNTAAFNTNGATYIYMAIRRGPMKTPTLGTSVFTPTTTATAGSPGALATTGFPTDLSIYALRNETGLNSIFFDRLRGTRSTSSARLVSSSTAAEASSVSNGLGIDSNTTVLENWTGSSGYNNVLWNFRRAPGFFDIVCYTGTGANRTVTHNLGVAPELMIIKVRDEAGRNWIVYQGNLGSLYLDGTFGSPVTTASLTWNNTVPTATVFSLGTSNSVNRNGYNYVAYLFASVAGVSKVGSYTGTGTTQVVNCGFTTGARFVLIKRTDSTGDWYVWDSARGIVAGNDPYLLLNSTAAEVTNTDYVDTASSGFEISSTAPADINANGGTFIFLAIA